jgi:hypothetical protein
VAKFAIKNADKQPTEELLKLSIYYQFDYRFCNARKGNEKGSVEKSVEYVRRKSFALLDEFEGLGAANTHLLRTLEELNQKSSKGQQQSIQCRFEQEKAQMHCIPPTPYDAGQLRRLRIDKYSCIKVDTNYYSIPEDYPGTMVEVKVYPELIRIYDGHLILTQHQRRHTRFEYFLHLEHYLKTLYTKPGALAGSKTLEQTDQQLRHIFQTWFIHRPAVFIDLLLFIRLKNLTIVQFLEAVEQCRHICPHQAPCEDKIKVLLTCESTPYKQPVDNAQQAHAQQAHAQLDLQIQQQARAQLQHIQTLFNA